MYENDDCVGAMLGPLGCVFSSGSFPIPCFHATKLTLFQVYDRCRGIDNDPVEPDPIPSRVSSQLSLVPLVPPAHYLGKPGEVSGNMCGEGETRAFSQTLYLMN